MAKLAENPAQYQDQTVVLDKVTLVLNGVLRGKNVEVRVSDKDYRNKMYLMPKEMDMKFKEAGFTEDQSYYVRLTCALEKHTTLEQWTVIVKRIDFLHPGGAVMKTIK